MGIKATTKAGLKKTIYALDRQLYLRGLRSTSSLTLPHFVGLGPGQSGTTWLATHLAEHPDVHIAPVKETHYFDRHIDEVPLGYYASLFGAGSAAIRGEITPGYSNLRRDRIALIKRLMPDLRLILIVRNPIERSWSAARRVMPKFGETITSIDEQELFNYLRLEWAYRAQNGAAVRGHYEPGLLEGHYCKTIDNWLEFFAPEQLVIIFFDDIQERPSTVLKQVCEHIGADPAYDWDPSAIAKAVNPNPPHQIPAAVYDFLQAQYRPEIERLAERIGGPAETWLAQLNGDTPLT